MSTFSLIVGFSIILVLLSYWVHRLLTAYDIQYNSLHLGSIHGISFKNYRLKNGLLIESVYIQSISIVPGTVSDSTFRLITLQIHGSRITLNKVGSNNPSIPSQSKSMGKYYPNLVLKLINASWVRFALSLFELDISLTEFVVKHDSNVLFKGSMEQFTFSSLGESLQSLPGLDSLYGEERSRCFGMSAGIDVLSIFSAEGLRILAIEGHCHFAMLSADLPKNGPTLGSILIFNHLTIMLESLQNLLNSLKSSQLVEVDKPIPKFETQDDIIQHCEQILQKYITNQLLIYKQSPRLKVLLLNTGVGFPIIKRSTASNPLDLLCHLDVININIFSDSPNVHHINVSLQMIFEGVTINIIPDGLLVGSVQRCFFHTEAVITQKKAALISQFDPPPIPSWNIKIESVMDLFDPFLMIDDNSLFLFLAKQKTKESTATSSDFSEFALIPISYFNKLLVLHLKINVSNVKFGLRCRKVASIKSDQMFDGFVYTFINHISFNLTSFLPPNAETFRAFSPLLEASQIPLFTIQMNIQDSGVASTKTSPSTVLHNSIFKESSKLFAIDLQVNTNVGSDLSFDTSIHLNQLYMDMTDLASHYSSIFQPMAVHLLGFIKKMPVTNTAKPKAEVNIPKGIIKVSCEKFMVTLASITKIQHFLVIDVQNIKATFNFDECITSSASMSQFQVQSISETSDPTKLCIIEELKMSQKNLQQPIQVETSEILMNASLTIFYQCLFATLPSVRIFKLFSKPKTVSSAVVEPKIFFTFKIPSILMKLELPEAVRLKFYFKELEIYNDSASEWKMQLNSIDIVYWKNESEKFRNLCSFTESDVKIIPPIAPNSYVIEYSTKSTSAVIPHSWPMSNIMENAILLNKAVKLLIQNHLSSHPDNPFAGGETFVDKSDIPTICFQSKEFEVSILDDPFEVALARNYRIGFVANAKRIVQEREFMKQAREHLAPEDLPRYSINIPHAVFDHTTSKAWQLLKKHFSTTYINAIREKIDQVEPPLLLAKFINLSINVSPPDCDDSLERMLHKIDVTTPPDLLYNDMVARNIHISLLGAEIRLRDFPNPLFYVPNDGDTRMETVGLMIVADPWSPAQSRKDIDLDLAFDTHSRVTVTKNVSPTKFYLQSVTTINTDSNVKACLGAPFEPGLADIISIIDSFTKPSTDPSPPVGWWDKLRIISHGSNILKVDGAGKLSVRFLGSQSPYFDPKKHFGVEGLEWSMSNGVEIDFGGEGDATGIIIECGEFKMIIPQSSYVEDSSLEEICFARLSGGVRVVISAEFLVYGEDGTDQVAPWRKHHEIVLLSDDIKLPANTVHDSFKGFRSESILVKLDIMSPRKYFSDLPFPQNCFFLNSTTISGIDKLLMTYQSLLTNVPIKRGNLFNSATSLFPKPKFGRVIRSVHLTAVFEPLMISLIMDCENNTEFVGVRLKAEQMSTDSLFRQYDVQQSVTVEMRKPVTKWIREASSISLIEIEGRALSYCDENSDLAIPSAYPNESAKIADLAGWIFKEDLIDDFSKLSLTTWIRAPRVDYLALEKSKHTDLTELAATKAIYEIQYKFFEIRLREIESLIWDAKRKRSLVEKRGAVFFDDTTNNTLENVVENVALLNDKKNVILKSMEYCKKYLKSKVTPIKPTETVDLQAFGSRYIFYNVKLLWNVPIRNIIFRIVELRTKNSALSYCLSNAASRVTTELVDSMTKRQYLNRRKASMANLNPSMCDIIETNDILESLINDLLTGTNFTVPCETDDVPIQSSVETEASEINPEIEVENDEIDFQVQYDVLYKCIHPQIKFEVVGPEIGKTAVIIGAQSMEIQILNVLDPHITNIGLDKDGNDSIMKFRNIQSLENAQLFIEKSFDEFDDIESNNFLNDDNEEQILWIPLECLMDYKVSAIKFDRIIDQAMVRLQIDKPNPLYIQRSQNKLHREDPHSFNFRIPNLKISSTSYQYLVLHDLFKYLLVYRDPASGDRTAKLKKILLALEQCDDIQYYRYAVLFLQEKLRQTDFILKYGKRNGLVKLLPAEAGKYQTSFLNFKNDILILMEGLKNFQLIQMKKNSLTVAMKLVVNVDNFVWMMETDNHVPLCCWSLQRFNFVWVDKEDKSSSNTLEIDRILVENMTPSPIYREIIAPYNPEGREINFEKQKMLRVFWRENAPVAGIQVIDHFEVNIHPLLIQLTLEFGKQLAYYIFPQTKAKASEPQQLNLATLKSVTSSNSQSLAENKTKRPIVSQNNTFKMNYNRRDRGSSQQLVQMQDRASQNKSFIYINVPGVQHCFSYRGSKEKNFEDLNKFSFHLPTLEYRNKTWTWFDLFNAMKRDALRAALANTGALVREKLFVKQKHHTIDEAIQKLEDLDLAQSNQQLEPSHPANSESSSKSKKGANAIMKNPFSKSQKATSHSHSLDKLATGTSEHGSINQLDSTNNSPRQSLAQTEKLTINQKGKLIFGKHFNLVTKEK
ncbi:golgi-body localization protein domain-containing protein [Globomyces pollinis-pini]|nr:golgi-body localization protein domain-containing protein [Globomyces pollinis-pini]